jgi:hypothetical protein
MIAPLKVVFFGGYSRIALGKRGAPSGNFGWEKVCDSDTAERANRGLQLLTQLGDCAGVGLVLGEIEVDELG